MKNTSAIFEASHAMSAEEIDQLEERIYEASAEQCGYRDARQISFQARENENLIGAVAGYTWGGICELRQVWVGESHRGRGVGKRLMSLAIEEARFRGCAYMFIATYEFQAPGFYAKLGFLRVAEIPDKPMGHVDVVMRLALNEHAE